MAPAGSWPGAKSRASNVPFLTSIPLIVFSLMSCVLIESFFTSLDWIELLRMSLPLIWTAA